MGDSRLVVDCLEQPTVCVVLQLITAVRNSIIYNFGQSVKMVIGVGFVVAVAVSQAQQFSVIRGVTVRCERLAACLDGFEIAKRVVSQCVCG